MNETIVALLLVFAGAGPCAAAVAQASAPPPLLGAIFHKNRAEALALIRSGADVGWVSEDGLTLLMYAGLVGLEDVQDALLAKGADAKARDRSGAGTIYYAVMWNHASTRQIGKLIAAGADVTLGGFPRGTTPLQGAANNCRADTVALLLASGAPADAGQPEGWTPLMQAAAVGCLPVAKKLLDAGADPGRRDRYQRTAAQVAAHRKHPALARWLLAAQKKGRSSLTNPRGS